MSTPVLSPVSMTSFYDPYTGAVLQASLYFYRSQTLDQISVWVDPVTGTNHQQPVLTGGSGRVPPIWIRDEGYYRIRSFDQYGTLLEDVDGLPGATPLPGEGGGGGTPGSLPPADSELDQNLDWTTLRPGDIFASFSAGGTKRPGAVRCNGGTIGQGAGGDPAPSEHAGLECYNLYVWLWGQDAAAPNNLLYMPAGKGSTATGDWRAGRLLTLPDLRGRTIVGLDPMGNGAPIGRMTGARFEKPEGTVITTGAGSDASVPGAGGGLAKLTLAIDQMPVHAHAVTDPKHVHTGTTSGESTTHTHAVVGSTAADGSHSHTYDRYTDSGAKNHASGTGFSRENVAATTAGTGAHAHSMAFQSGGQSVEHTHTYSTTAELTGIVIVHAGGKGTAPTVPADFVTQPFNLAQPFLTLTWFMSLGPKYPDPVIPP